MFEIGSKVIHPLHGLGDVNEIKNMDILGQTGSFACISFPAARLNVMVNLEQKASMIRPLIHADEISGVMSKLKEPYCTLSTRSSERYSTNIKKIKSCDIYQLAEVVRDLTGLSKSHKLSPKEQAMLGQARKSLAVEFSYITDKNEDEVEAEINRACRKED